MAGLAAALTLLVSLAGPAAAASYYRYWGFYELDGTTWAYAQKGADQTTPKDGAVEGWRFAVASETDVRTPRGVLTFDEICGATAAADGSKRVGVVIDYGRAADAETGEPPAPRSACAVVDASASASQVLAAVASPRSESGMVCGVDGWPATGCGGAVASPSALAVAADETIVIAAPGSSATATPLDGVPTAVTSTAAADTGSSGPSTGVWIGIIAVLVVLAGVVAAFVSRRGKDQA